MATIANLMVKIGADISGLSKGLQSTQRKLETFAGGLDNAGRTLTAGLTAPILAVGTASLKMAMDAVESENLFTESMGKMADSARSWSEQLRKDLGLNAYEVRKNVATFNVMLGSMGIAENKAYDMSKGLTQLAYDMASFYNLKPEEAFLKLQAGISGEVEPLKRLGILVNENTVETIAYTKGIAKQGKKLTEQQKVMARYEAIMEQTKKAQGDLARTMDSPTNQLRIMGEQAKNLAIDLGMSLIPMFQELLGKGEDVLVWVKGMVDRFTALPQNVKNTIVEVLGFTAVLGPLALGISTVIKIISTFAGGISGLIGFIGKVVAAFGAWSAGSSSLVAALTSIMGTIGWIITGVAALAAAFIYLWNTNEDFRKGVIAIWEQIKAYWAQWSPIVTSILNNAWLLIQTAAQSVFNALLVFWQNWGSVIIALFTAVWETIKNIVGTGLTIIDNLIKLVLNVISGNWAGAWENIKAIGKAVWDFIGKEIQILANFLSTVFVTVKNNIIQTFTDIWNGVVGIVGKIVDQVNKAVSAIKSLSKMTSEKAPGSGSTVNPRIQGFARGGTITRSGAAIVGEHGPEIVNLAKGNSVVPNNKLGGGQTIVQVVLDGRVIQEYIDNGMGKKALGLGVV